LVRVCGSMQKRRDARETGRERDREAVYSYVNFTFCWY